MFYTMPALIYLTLLMLVNRSYAFAHLYQKSKMLITMDDLKNRKKQPFDGQDQPAEKDSKNGYSLHKAPDDWIPGNGLLDRYEHLESMSSYWKRILSSKYFWIRVTIYSILQYLAYKVEMGEPFFVIALIFAIYQSMASPSLQDRRNIRSAYSVFNIGKSKHSTIHGDTSFKDLDKQLRSGGF